MWFLVALMPFFASDMIYSFMGYVLRGVFGQHLGDAVIFRYLVFGLVQLGIFGVWYWKEFGMEATVSPAKRLSRAPVALVAAGIGMQFVSAWVLAAEAYLLPAAMTEYEDMIEYAAQYDFTFSMIIYSLILAPIAEECIFRGLTLGYLQRAIDRFWLANIIQAVLFGVFHRDLIQGIYAFAMGLCLGYIREKYGTIWAGIVVHVVFNLIGYLTPYVLLPEICYTPLVFFMLAACGYAIVVMREMGDKNEY